MNKVSHLNQFPKDIWVEQVFGKDYPDAVQNAEKLIVDPISYYEQIHCGHKSKSILVAYKKVYKDENDLGGSIGVFGAVPQV